MTPERGAYLTPNRAEALMREIVALEARFQEKVDRLERELAEVRQQQLDTLRAQTAASMEVLRGALHRTDEEAHP